MNTNQLIGQIRNTMPQFEGTEEEKELCTLFYIYWQIGMQKSFDERHFFGTREQKEKIYRLAERREQHIDEIAEKKKIICNESSFLLKNVLRAFGFDTFITTPQKFDPDHHIFVIVMLKSGRFFRCDLTKDIYHMQTQSKTKHFANMPHDNTNYEVDSLTEDELLNLYIKTGYIHKKEDLRNYKMAELKNELQGLPPQRALNLLLNDERVYGSPQPIEISELYSYYRWVLNKTVSTYMHNQIDCFEAYRQKDDGKRNYTMCIYAEEQNKIDTYLYFPKESRFASVTPKQFLEMIQNGLILKEPEVVHQTNFKDKLKNLFAIPALDRKNADSKDKVLHYIESEGNR